MSRAFEHVVGPYAGLKARDELGDDLGWDNDVLMEAHQLNQLRSPTSMEETDLYGAFFETEAAHEASPGLSDQYSPHVGEPLDLTRHHPPWNPVLATSIHDNSGATASPIDLMSPLPDLVTDCDLLSNDQSFFEADGHSHNRIHYQATSYPPYIAEDDGQFLQSHNIAFARSTRYHAGSAFADYAHSAAMSRTHSLAFSEHDGSQLNNLNDNTSVNGDYMAGIPLDHMEGVESVQASFGNPREVQQPLEYESTFLSEADTHDVAQSAPDFLGAMFLNNNELDQMIHRASPTWQTAISVELSQTPHGSPPFRRPGETHDARLSGSFPLTNYRSPTSELTTKVSSSRTMPGLFGKRPRTRAASSPQLDVSQAVPISASLRSKRNTNVSTKADSGRLTAIAERRETNSPSHVSSSTGSPQHSLSLTLKPPRAKRTHQLSEEQRIKAAVMRKGKLTCLACRARKVACDGEDPCTTCVKSRDGRVCLTSEWHPWVEQAACDNPFHLSIFAAHQGTLLSMSPTFDPAMIVAFLHRFQATHSIRVTHATGAAYQIDLVICFNILSKIHRQFQLFDLFDEKGIKASPEAWLDAVIEVGETETEAQRYLQCSVMPSHAVYEFVSLDDNATCSDIQDHKCLRAAASLSRIILRAHELLTHRAMQRACMKLVPGTLKLEDHDGLVCLVEQLGKLACTMRLRHAFCMISHRQDEYRVDTQDQLRCDIERLQTVAKIIYFWYHYALRKRNKDVDRRFHDAPNTLHANGTTVKDPFPGSVTNEGFEAWLADGERILEQTGLAPQPPQSIKHQQQHPPYHMQTQAPHPLQQSALYDQLWLQTPFSMSVP